MVKSEQTHEILFSHEKEGNLAVCCNMEMFWGYYPNEINSGALRKKYHMVLVKWKKSLNKKEKKSYRENV